MSTLLTAQSLHVDTAFGPLFSDISFTLKKGDRLGLIGYNGCGKSTLLKVLDGTLAPPRAAFRGQIIVCWPALNSIFPPKLTR
jgi:ATPase subunit of ABC transporter with duplicated ATPase domains